MPTDSHARLAQPLRQGAHNNKFCVALGHCFSVAKSVQNSGYRTSRLSRPSQHVIVIAVTWQAVTSRLRRLRVSERRGHKCQWLCGEELRVQPTSLERTAKGLPVLAAVVEADVSAGRQRAVGQNDWPAPAASRHFSSPFRWDPASRDANIAAGR